jgi:hypothetical protein
MAILLQRKTHRRKRVPPGRLSLWAHRRSEISAKKSLSAHLVAPFSGCGNLRTTSGSFAQVNALLQCKECQAFAVCAVTTLGEAFSTKFSTLLLKKFARRSRYSCRSSKGSWQGALFGRKESKKSFHANFPLPDRFPLTAFLFVSPFSVALILIGKHNYMLSMQPCAPS